MIKPIIFFSNILGSNINIFELFNNSYKLKSISKITRKYKILKNFYFILSYSDFILLDKSFFKDFYSNNSLKVLKYLEKYKKLILFFYYNGKIYTYKNLLKLINFNKFSFTSFYLFLQIGHLNKNFLKILIYIKKKNANY